MKTFKEWLTELAAADVPKNEKPEDRSKRLASDRARGFVLGKKPVMRDKEINSIRPPQMKKK